MKPIKCSYKNKVCEWYYPRLDKCEKNGMNIKYAVKCNCMSCPEDIGKCYTDRDSWIVDHKFSLDILLQDIYDYEYRIIRDMSDEVLKFCINFITINEYQIILNILRNDIIRIPYELFFGKVVLLINEGKLPSLEGLKP